jgi:16S rRNA (guanine966-N2)-methyltransferase
VSIRILGGRWRSRPLRVAKGSRPTESRVREALFSILGQKVEGCAFADLFAGSGAIGFEALSRGAATCFFVDGSAESQRVLRENARDLELSEDKAQFRRKDLSAGLGSVAYPFHFIFADPPYAFIAGERFFGGLEGALLPSGILIFEHAARNRPTHNGGWRQLDHRRYGDCCLSFYGLSSEAVPTPDEDGQTTHR